MDWRCVCCDVVLVRSYRWFVCFCLGFWGGGCWWWLLLFLVWCWFWWWWDSVCIICNFGFICGLWLGLLVCLGYCWWLSCSVGSFLLSGFVLLFVGCVLVVWRGWILVFCGWLGIYWWFFFVLVCIDWVGLLVGDL